MTALQILWLVAAILTGIVLVMRAIFWPAEPALQVALFALFVHCLSGTGQVK